MNRVRCGPGRCMNGFGGPGGGGWVGWLDSVALWILAVIAITVLVRMILRGRDRRARWAARGGYGPGRGPGAWAGYGPGPAAAGPPQPFNQAESLLAERFARGEIGPDEYRQSLGVLRGYEFAAPPPPAEPGGPVADPGPEPTAPIA